MADAQFSVRLPPELAAKLEAAAGGERTVASVLRAALQQHFVSSTEPGVTPSPGSASFSLDSPEEPDPFLTALDTLISGANASKALWALLEAHARDPRLAEMALRADGLLGTDRKGALVFVFDGEELPLDRTGLYRTLSPVLLKSAGVPGSGAPTPSLEPLGSPNAGALDVERAKSDLSYYNAHKEQVWDYLRRKREG